MKRKLIPIPFKPDMALANMENRKSETRRTRGLDIINENPDDWQFEWADFALKLPYRLTKLSSCTPETMRSRTFYQEAIKSPYGAKGDIFWMRETHSVGHDSSDGSPCFAYKADGGADKWKPSIHMPLMACRYFAEITSVRLERLHDITDEGAIAEGINSKNQYPRDWYETLWSVINGLESWGKNPWVWVVKYRRVDVAWLKANLDSILQSRTSPKDIDNIMSSLCYCMAYNMEQDIKDILKP